MMAGTEMRREATDPAMRPLQLLIADDMADHRMIFQAYLAGTPHRAVLAADGSDALARVVGGHFDLVLMDMQMPVMDGYEATRAIRRWEREHGRPALPIVGLTAAVLGPEIQLAWEAGCTCVIAKPVGRRELLAVLAAAATVPAVRARPAGSP